jgi:hypothetical protein
MNCAFALAKQEFIVLEAILLEENDVGAVLCTKILMRCEDAAFGHPVQALLETRQWL